jgi:hypothetical protein
VLAKVLLFRRASCLHQTPFQATWHHETVATKCLPHQRIECIWCHGWEIEPSWTRCLPLLAAGNCPHHYLHVCDSIPYKELRPWLRKYVPLARCRQSSMLACLLLNWMCLKIKGLRAWRNLRDVLLTLGMISPIAIIFDVFLVFCKICIISLECCSYGMQ